MDGLDHPDESVDIHDDAIVLLRAVWADDHARLFAEIEREVLGRTAVREVVLRRAVAVHRAGPATLRLRLRVPRRLVSRMHRLSATAPGGSVAPSAFLEAAIVYLTRLHEH